MISEEEYFKLSRGQRSKYTNEILLNSLKACPSCKKFLSIDDFEICHGRGPTSKQTYCRICRRNKKFAKQGRIPPIICIKPEAQNLLTHKICDKCKTEKLFQYFDKELSTKDHLSRWCKECKKEYYKTYKRTTPHSKIAIQRSKQRQKLRRIIDPEWRKEQIAKKKRWSEDNKEHVKEYNKRRSRERKNNPDFKLKELMRRCINKKRTKISFSKEGKRLIGCSPQEFYTHMQIQFPTTENWIDNIGQNKYHLDHIIPLEAFDLTMEYHKELAFNYRNIQPLEGKINASKSNNLYKAKEFLIKKIEKFGIDEFYSKMLRFLEDVINNPAFLIKTCNKTSNLPF